MRSPRSGWNTESRVAHSRCLTVARASSRFAVLAQARSSSVPTTKSNMNTGRDTCSRSSEKPAAVGVSPGQMLGAASRMRAGVARSPIPADKRVPSSRVIQSMTGPSSADAACSGLTPGCTIACRNVGVRFGAASGKFPHVPGGCMRTRATDASGDWRDSVDMRRQSGKNHLTPRFRGRARGSCQMTFGIVVAAAAIFRRPRAIQSP